MTLLAVKRAQRRNAVHQETARRSRENLIEAVEKARESHSLQEIGEVLGMTRQGVYEMLKR